MLCTKNICLYCCAAASIAAAAAAAAADDDDDDDDDDDAYDHLNLFPLATITFIC